MIKRKWWIFLCCAVAFVGFAAWLLWANTALELNIITLREENLPENFDGFRIAQVSDLHSAEMGMGNAHLLAMLKEAEPDAIVITGDLMDRRDRDTSVVLAFVDEAVEIAPCYYVDGNHELRLKREVYDQLIEGLAEAGVTVLRDESILLSRNGQFISLSGRSSCPSDMVGSLSGFEGYRILLSHHPELFSYYVQAGYDLVFSGHAHGGQFRLPWVGGLFAPGQGFFPEYDSGIYTQRNTHMVVSRGIGNSAFPLRFNNRPEVILVVLQS